MIGWGNAAGRWLRLGPVPRIRPVVGRKHGRAAATVDRGVHGRRKRGANEAAGEAAEDGGGGNPGEDHDSDMVGLQVLQDTAPSANLADHKRAMDWERRFAPLAGRLQPPGSPQKPAAKRPIRVSHEQWQETPDLVFHRIRGMTEDDPISKAHSFPGVHELQEEDVCSRLGQNKPLGVQPKTWACEAMDPKGGVGRTSMKPCVDTAQMWPTKILLIRHGEANPLRDPVTGEITPDASVCLTEKGMLQSKHAGRRLKNIIGDLDVYMYYSPYGRAKQSAELIARVLDASQIVRVTEEPRIAEQQVGGVLSEEDIQACKTQREHFGRFFFRFPNGEAGLDVYNRITGFIETLRRRHHRRDCCIVIVTHGLTLRLFLMRFFQWTVEQFEATTSPPHCGIALMKLDENGERYRLTPQTLDMVGAGGAPSTTAIGRSMLRKAYVNAFLSY